MGYPMQGYRSAAARTYPGFQSDIGSARPPLTAPANDNWSPPANDNRPRVSNSSVRDIWKRTAKTATKSAIRRTAARAALRAGVRFIPYVGAAVSIYDALSWLYWLFNNITCGMGGTPGNVRTCFGFEQLYSGQTSPIQNLAPGQVNVNFYRFWRMNFSYQQWRSIGKGRLNNPWVGDGSDKWTNPWPQPKKEPGILPWEEVDPFLRPPWAPPSEWAPSWENTPGWRSNPDRSPSEQSDRGNGLPNADGWPMGHPRPRPAGDPHVVIQPRPGTGTDPIVVPLPPVRPNPKPRPEPDVGGEPGSDPANPKPRPRPRPRPDGKPRSRWVVDRHPKRRPPKREKEIKSKGVTPAWMQAIIGPATEIGDWADAAFDALPCKLRQRLWVSGGRAGGKFLTPDEKIAAVYRNWKDIDVNALLYNIAKNELEDRVIAALAKYEARTRQRNFDRYGVQQGKSTSSQASWALRGLRDLQKQIKSLPGGSPPCS